MNGTEKQIAWAEDIMAKVSHWVNRTELGITSDDINDDERAVVQSIVDKVKSDILTMADAKAIIDNRDKVTQFDYAAKVMLNKAGHNGEMVLAKISAEANRKS